ncbi:hypothetical protein Tco_1292482, partial [Tanacetum coccineum]
MIHLEKRSLGNPRDTDNDNDEIDIEQPSGDMSVIPLPNVINADAGASAQGCGGGDVGGGGVIATAVSRGDGGDGGEVRRVTGSELVDRGDPDMELVFGVGRKIRPEKFFGGGATVVAGDGRQKWWWGGGRIMWRGRENLDECVRSMGAKQGAGFGIGGKIGKGLYKLGCDRERLKMIK